MPNQLLLDRIGAIQAALVAHHRGGAALPSASRGSEREMLLREFLAVLFPEGFRFGSGAITDSTGLTSGQLDIVIEYPFLPSFLMPSGGERLYLAESVALVVSVKSNLVDQWKQVESEVEALKPLRRRWSGTVHVRENSIDFCGPAESPVPFMAIGYTGYQQLDSLENRLLTTEESVRPDAALVIDSGAFVGFGWKAQGPTGLYAAAAVASDLLCQVQRAGIDLFSYVQ